jgi:outer membrane protein assembly factor BamB
MTAGKCLGYTGGMLRRDVLKSLIAFFPAGVLFADTWPQFRGPDARGVAADDPRLPLVWSETQNIVWRSDVPGRGWSSPIVWNDRIFLQSCISASDMQSRSKGMFGGRQQYRPPGDEHRWMLYCFDLKGGSVQWAAELYKGIPKISRHPKNTFASETPVTDGEHVYAHIGDLGTYCFDMNGGRVWYRQWPPVETRYGYGTASSPVLYRDRLYLVNDNEMQSYLLALDKKTGREIWKVDRDEPTTWGTPCIWRNELRTEIVTAGTNKVRSYSLEGRLLWEISGMAPLSIPSPFSCEGILYVSSGYPASRQRPAYAVRPGAGGDITLKSGETSNKYIAWSLPRGGPYLPSPLVYKGRYYTLFDEGILTCHDAKTGREIYGKQRVAAAGFTGSPWAYNDRIFCLSEDGDTYVVQAGDTFKLLAQNSLDDTCLATPAIADGSLILRTLTRLYRIENS